MKSTWSICTVYMEYAVSYTEPHILMESQHSLRTPYRVLTISKDSVGTPNRVPIPVQSWQSLYRVLAESQQSSQTLLGLCLEFVRSPQTPLGLYWDCIGTVLEHCNDTIRCPNRILTEF